MTNTENTSELPELGKTFAALQASQNEVTRAVQAARAEGSSWASIGRVLGITKQAAQQKYGKNPAVEPKLAETDVAGPSVTPSIFLEPKSPAKKKAAPKFAKAYGDEYPKTRPVYTLPGTPPTTAQPGTGKGKHQCPSCGDTNHHGPKRGTVAMFADCTPTKYDPPATAEFMTARTSA